MRLAKATANLVAALTVSLCLIPGGWAQITAVKRAKAARKAVASGAKQAVPKPAATGCRAACRTGCRDSSNAV